METSPSEAEESSSESIPLVTPMVRFLVSDSEDVSPRSPDSPMQEAPFQVDNASSQEGESLDSWSDPDETIATLGENVGLAERIF